MRLIRSRRTGTAEAGFWEGSLRERETETLSALLLLLRDSADRPRSPTPTGLRELKRGYLAPDLWCLAPLFQPPQP
jgi:hypothetical protein